MEGKVVFKFFFCLAIAIRTFVVVVSMVIKNTVSSKSISLELKNKRHSLDDDHRNNEYGS